MEIPDTTSIAQARKHNDRARKEEDKHRTGQEAQERKKTSIAQARKHNDRARKEDNKHRTGKEGKVK